MFNLKHSFYSFNYLLTTNARRMPSSKGLSSTSFLKALKQKLHNERFLLREMFQILTLFALLFLYAIMIDII